MTYPTRRLPGPLHPTSAPRPYVTTRAAARRLNVHPNTIRNWVDAGILGADRDPSGVRRVFASEVERIEKERTVDTYETICFNATATSEAALARAVARGDGDSPTDVLNRAVQVYDRLDEVWRNGGHVLLQPEPNGSLETLTVY